MFINLSYIAILKTFCHVTVQITSLKSFVLIMHEKMENNNELTEIDIKNRTCY